MVVIEGSDILTQPKQTIAGGHQCISETIHRGTKPLYNTSSNAATASMGCSGDGNGIGLEGPPPPAR